MTENKEEIEKVKAQIKVLEKKLSFLEELEKTKSPVEEAYKDWMGVYPPTGPSVDGIDDIRWRAFQRGYDAAYAEKVSEEPQKWDAVRESVKWCEENPDKDPLDWVKPQTQEEVKKLQEKDWEIKVETDYRTGKARHKTRIVDKDGNDYKSKPLTTEELLKPNWEPKSQSEEEVADGLKEAFREAVKQGVVSSVEKPKDDFMDKMVAKLKGQTLTDMIYDWWEDIFTVQSNDDMETSIADLVDRIEAFLPKPQSSAGSQNVYVESAVEGFNDAIKQIKSKLR